MTLPNTIQDTYTAGREWMKRRLELDEFTLPDYERPLKTITEKGKSPFQKQIAQYGFAQAVFKNFLP